MKNTIKFLGIIALAVIIGFSFFACGGGEEEEADTWTKVTSLDQMDGTWKGNFKYTTSISDMFGGDEEDGEDGEDGGGMFDSLGDIKVSMTVDMTTIINAREKTEAGSSTTTMVFSGGKIKEVWPLIKAFLTMGDPEEGTTVASDDSKHSITITSSSAAEPITDEKIKELLDQGLQINQKGNKIKYPANAMHKGSPAVILNKQ